MSDWYPADLTPPAQQNTEEVYTEFEKIFNSIFTTQQYPNT